MSQQTYARLTPLTIRQRIDIAFEALSYFDTGNQKVTLSLMGKEPMDSKVRPLCAFDFLEYLDKKGVLPEARRYAQVVGQLLNSLESAGWLQYMGPSGSVLLPKTYYALRQATNIEKKGLYSLSLPLGIDYLHALIAPNLVHVTGVTPDKDVHAGTGMLVSSNVILTCAHVLKDMEVDDELMVRGVPTRVLNTAHHQEIDVGLVYLDGRSETDTHALPFVEPQIGMDVAILGYPLVPIAQTAPLTLQKGEVTCAEILSYYGQRLFLFSAIARPGNSGGPILSTSGQFLGLVSQDVTMRDASCCEEGGAACVEQEKQGGPKSKPSNAFAPHYCGIPTCEIVRAVNDLDPAVKLPVEDYQ